MRCIMPLHDDILFRHRLGNKCAHHSSAKEWERNLYLFALEKCLETYRFYEFAHYTVLLDEMIAEHVLRLKNQLLASAARCTGGDNCAAPLYLARNSDIIDIWHFAMFIIPCLCPHPQHLDVGECEKRCGATKRLLMKTVVSDVGESEHSVNFITLIEHYDQCTLANCPLCMTLKRLFTEHQSAISQALGRTVFIHMI